MRRVGANGWIGLALVGGFVAMALVALAWTPADPLALNLRARFRPPGGAFPLGTDEFGRDVLSRVMAGAATSLWIAAASVALALVLGVAVGLVAGFARGLVDRLLMVANDALLAFPGILLALAVMVVVGASPGSLILALGLAYAPSVVRVVRGVVLSLREREFVEASFVVGNGPVYTVLRHVLPNCIAPIAVLATSMLGFVVLSESALSFLGLGVPPPAPTWGNMLSAARPHLLSAPWLGLVPGTCIALTLLGFNLLGDALRDWLDPRMGR
jgi:peptide/nickel transport system permease protein